MQNNKLPFLFTHSWYTWQLYTRDGILVSTVITSANIWYIGPCKWGFRDSVFKFQADQGFWIKRDLDSGFKFHRLWILDSDFGLQGPIYRYIHLPQLISNMYVTDIEEIITCRLRMQTVATFPLETSIPDVSQAYQNMPINESYYTIGYPGIAPWSLYRHIKLATDY